jgi:preprotein translocase subunit YajC
MNQGGGLFIYLLLFVGILYFMMIRPQQKQQKKRQEMMNALQINNQIITIGGIHGKIKKIRDKTVTIKIADHVEIEIQKSAIGSVIDEEEMVAERNKEKEVEADIEKTAE